MKNIIYFLLLIGVSFGFCADKNVCLKMCKRDFVFTVETSVVNAKGDKVGANAISVNVQTINGEGEAFAKSGVSVEDFVKANCETLDGKFSTALMNSKDKFLGSEISIKIRPTKETNCFEVEISFSNTELEGFTEHADGNLDAVFETDEMRNRMKVQLGVPVTTGGLLSEKINSDGKREKLEKKIVCTLKELN